MPKLKTFREIRREANITQQQLADALNVSNTSVNLWENAHFLPSLDKAYELSELLSIDLGYLARILIVEKRKKDKE